MSDDPEVDLPPPPSADEIPAWIKEANEKARGLGFNPQNARKMVAGGEKKQEEYDPSEEDMVAARKFFSHMWDVYMDWRKNRPAMQNREKQIAGWHEQQGKNKEMSRDIAGKRAREMQVHLGDESMDYAGMQREPE
jgi:hypothetical protein